MERTLHQRKEKERVSTTNVKQMTSSVDGSSVSGFSPIRRTWRQVTFALKWPHRWLVCYLAQKRHHPARCLTTCFYRKVTCKQRRMFCCHGKSCMTAFPVLMTNKFSTTDDGKREESSSLGRISYENSLKSDRDSVEPPHHAWFGFRLVWLRGGGLTVLCCIHQISLIWPLFIKLSLRPDSTRRQLFRYSSASISSCIIASFK